MCLEELGMYLASYIGTNLATCICANVYLDTLEHTVNGEGFTGLNFHDIHISYMDIFGNIFVVQGQGAYV